MRSSAASARRLVIAFLSFGVLACGDPPPRASVAPARQGRPVAAAVEHVDRPREHARTAATNVYALLINGGDRPERNYQSHYLHVREMADLLLAHGVPRSNIVVFASDGADPAPDLAVLDDRRERLFDLIDGTGVGSLLRPGVRLVDSRFDDLDVRPAKRAALHAWFESTASKLEPGSVLLVYVTDHGQKNANDLRNNSLLLWGESLDVDELRDLLGLLPAGVRTLMVMSQCFSGSFGALTIDAEGGGMDGSVCGYFSSPADRFAYGCYPENRGKKNVGYSFELLDALRGLGSFERSQERVVLSDATPDVPNRTSDQYLDLLVRSRAGAYGLSSEEFSDSLLAKAYVDEAFYAPAFARIDTLASRFGATSARALGDLRERSRALPRLRDELRSYAERWDAALNALRNANVSRFLAADPDWYEALQPGSLENVPADTLRTLRHAFLRDLARFTRDDTDTFRRIRSLEAMARSSKEAAYRMEVRLAVTLRMRDMLTRVAGQVFLDQYGTAAERAAYEALRGCEDLELFTPLTAPARSRDEAPFPPLDEEIRLAATVMPGWIGVQFQPVEGALRKGLGVGEGAVEVTAIEPGSPAAQADLRVGDVILGPPAEHFRESRQIREWVMTSIVGQQRQLDVHRAGETFPVTLTIAAPPEHGAAPPEHASVPRRYGTAPPEHSEARPAYGR